MTIFEESDRTDDENISSRAKSILSVIDQNKKNGNANIMKTLSIAIDNSLERTNIPMKMGFHASTLISTWLALFPFFF